MGRVAVKPPPPSSLDGNKNGPSRKGEGLKISSLLSPPLDRD